MNKKVGWLDNQFLHKHLHWMVKILGSHGSLRTDHIKEITSYWWRSFGYFEASRIVVVVSLGLRASPVFAHTTGGLFNVLFNIFYIQTEWISWLEDGCSFLGGLTIIDSWWSAFDQLELQGITDAEKPCKEQEIQQESLGETRKPYQTFVILHTVTNVIPVHIQIITDLGKFHISIRLSNIPTIYPQLVGADFLIA